MEIQHLRGNVRKWKIRNHNVGIIQSLSTSGGQHGLHCPCNVVVGDHDGLGRTSGTRRVNQSTSVTRFPGPNAFLDLFIRNVGAKLAKFLVSVHWDGTLLLDISGNGSPIIEQTVHHQRFEVWQLFANCQVFLRLFETVANDHLSLGMFGNVVTSFRLVCCVNSSGNTSGGHGTKVGKNPFRSVESNNVHNIKRFKSQRKQ
mmetsp:Transcript_5452/g.11582  ORF Transcript_5452/g.11582 Transcript_5452/m.11582 type:complete len:201 (+) Transcript_5452:544-1146(+)